MKGQAMTDHFAVTVERNGEKIVTIETNCLSGRDLRPGDEDVILTAVRHLLAFIGAADVVTDDAFHGGEPMPGARWP
jgi:hypothetical protein